MSGVLLEARSFRPFKSSEEYLYAMKEDLAEWLQCMYPQLNIHVDNFLDKLETGVVLCEHANAVKAQAEIYAEKKQARKVMTRSVTGSLAQAQTLVKISDVKYFSSAKRGTFFARDNVCNFIDWCRSCLKIIECLLFESDDLIMRKNEKHVILCLLEVARRGAKFGMLAPMLVQMERQIDREIAADQKKLGINEGTENQNNQEDDSEDSDIEDENPVLMYGPLPQIITNDLKSLDEMVRDLVEKCTCPTQFPMIRVSEGKYRIGDTKVLIFVRILRNHVMVRVGGGWDTLSHYLDKHDPCRCRSQHRTTQGARLVNKPGAVDLHGSHVYYDRSAVSPAHQNPGAGLSNAANSPHTLGPPMNSLNRSRSRSPSYMSYTDSRRSLSPNVARKTLHPPPNRSRSPTPNFTSTHLTKLSNNNKGLRKNQVPNTKHVSTMQIPLDNNKVVKTEAVLQVNDTDHSDTTSEMSDEGYRSLGLVQDKNGQRPSLCSHNSIEDGEENEHSQCAGDDTNDFGLKKTQFSTRIYEDNPDVKLDSLKSIKQRPEEVPLEIRGKSPSKTPPKPIPTQKSMSQSKINSWNGRQKQPRAALGHDTFTSPFARNSPTRRSASSLGCERRSSSANTSPTKGKLRQEILETVEQTEDECKIVEQVRELLKKYGSLSTLDNEGGFVRQNSERKSYRSPRKDSRPENNYSKIPAPVYDKAA